MNLESDTRAFRTRRHVVYLFILGISVGCSSSEVEHHGDKTPNHLTVVYNAYKTANERNRRPPVKWQELKPFIPKGKSLEEMKKSAIDGNEYVVVWGYNVAVAQNTSPEPIIFAYEKTGKDGTRWVATTMGVMQKNAAEFKNGKFAPGHNP